MTQPRDPSLPIEWIVAEERRKQGDGHTSGQRLATYRAGELDPAEAEEIQAHLAVCPECTRSLLSLSRFQELMEAEDVTEVATPEELPGEGQTENSWLSQRARLARRESLTASAGAAPRVQPATPRLRRMTMSPFTLRALAASLLTGLIGFALGTYRPSNSVGAPFVLFPPSNGEVTRGTGSSSELLTVRLAEGPAVLALPLPARASFPAYSVEIRTPDGELRLSVEAQPVPAAVGPGSRSPAAGEEAPGLLAVGLDRGSLAPGDYRLRLVGLRGAHGEVIAEHPLRVPAS